MDTLQKILTPLTPILFYGLILFGLYRALRATYKASQKRPKQAAALLIAFGVLLCIGGFISFLSIKSQFQRASGGTDITALVCFILGVPSLCTGLYVLYGAGVSASSAAPTQSHADSTPEERLRQLGDLKDKGVITPEEYEQRRREIVGAL